MTLTSSITDLLHHFMTALKSVVPLSVTHDEPTLLITPYEHQHFTVSIGMTGDVQGRFVINGTEKNFQSLAAFMFGMPLTGEMLESFAGELGNMIVGNLATAIASSGHNVDITTPTVMTGEASIIGNNRVIQLPLTVKDAGRFHVLLVTVP
ncbi:chemotaxis protein CheX [Rossellomorea aquimaris]|uniref:Chemotaxis protein CheX n=1 Tax=Rossellomorea aquimaris TaxID=189382 RepID=A0A1J6WSV0_9BACI|nr:chemotaxis protein CheX [Rossellomorea aquimaris]OIU71291.1 chemotaxis protein CheX [Rossellomorea aquimaris]